MSKTSLVRVYIATSLDGFIAGPGDDLSFLDSADPGTEAGKAASRETDPDALGYDDFIGGVGALLMGRRTYDVVRSFDIPWPYGHRPVLVASRRPLDADPPATVRRVEGSIGDIVGMAREAARGADVYLDGGVLIRQAAEAGLIDDLTLTLAPTALGAGVPLFAGMSRAYPLEIVSHHRFAGGMTQLRMRPVRPDAAAGPTDPG